jgi:hypothetical protein
MDFCGCVRALGVPACDQVFNNVRLVLAPYQSAHVLPASCAVVSKYAVCRHAADTEGFCFGGEFTKLGFDSGCVGFRDQVRAIVAALCENILQYGFVGDVGVVFPACGICSC